MSNIEDIYFLDIDDEALEFVERESEQCVDDVNKANIALKEQAFKILNLLIVGIGSSFILMTQMTNFNFLSFGLFTFILCWLSCSIYIVYYCLVRKNRPLTSTKPEYLYKERYKNLNDEDYKLLVSLGYKGKKDALPVIRRFRLYSLSLTIDDLLITNEKVSKKLNESIIAATTSPILSMIVAIIYKFISS